jgi:hypothetical protein
MFDATSPATHTSNLQHPKSLPHSTSAELTTSKSTKHRRTERSAVSSPLSIEWHVEQEVDGNYY